VFHKLERIEIEVGFQKKIDANIYIEPLILSIK